MYTTHKSTTARASRPADDQRWAEVRRNLRLADIAAFASKNAITRAEADLRLEQCLRYSTKAMLQAGTLLGQPIGSVSEVRRLLEEQGL